MSLDRLTRRQKIITQARQLLGSLQDPRFFEINSTLIFEINECEFEFTEEQMEELVDE